MRFSTFLYSVKQGMKNIGRNKMFSLASIATMAACIFLFGIFFSVVTNFKTMVKTAEEGVAVTVFFEKGIEQDKIDEIGKEIKKRPEVAKYDFVSADEAWKDFQKEYAKLIGTSRRISLSDAVFYLGENFQGAEHDALWDARNTAEVFKLSKDEENFFRIMAPVIDVYKPKKNLTYSLSEAFGDIHLGE